MRLGLHIRGNVIAGGGDGSNRSRGKRRWLFSHFFCYWRSREVEDIDHGIMDWPDAK